VHQRFQRVLAQMMAAGRRARERSQGQLADALEHFVKVSGSYEPGLFHCSDLADVQPTNNDMEQVFGSSRHHGRRVSGRKKGSASVVLRDSARLVAALATRLVEEVSPTELAPRDLQE
jgi:hypothetical protein